MTSRVAGRLRPAQVPRLLGCLQAPPGVLRSGRAGDAGGELGVSLRWRGWEKPEVQERKGVQEASEG